jgi:CRISPR-associated protein (TIGR03985 family)
LPRAIPRQKRVVQPGENVPVRSPPASAIKTASTLLQQTAERLDWTTWKAEVVTLSGLNPTDLDAILREAPFATVHRSLRDDLKQLVTLGWLQTEGRGCFLTVPPRQWPSLPGADPPGTVLSISETWELLRVLESVAFVQPQLDVIINTLWEQVSQPRAGNAEPVKRIFLQLDYILPPEVQERVDGHQEHIEQLWQSGGGVIQFDYWQARRERQVPVIVYPVCLHYVRRAKYLSAYGLDPQGQIQWHNYRLDRIRSQQLRVLPWGDPTIPAALKQRWRTGHLPTPDEVEAQLDAAWGFDFYRPRAWLLLRFPPDFARDYVENTVRHCTFEPIPYQTIPQRMAEVGSNPEEQRQLLQLLQHRSPEDAYYCADIRLGDINVIQRLRDWRPKGEVMAPLSMRQQMRQEVQAEWQHYGEI